MKCGNCGFKFNMARVEIEKEMEKKCHLIFLRNESDSDPEENGYEV